MKPSLREMLEACVAVMGWADLKDAAESVGLTVAELQEASKPSEDTACDHCGHPYACQCEEDRSYPGNVLENGVAS